MERRGETREEEWYNLICSHVLPLLSSPLHALATQATLAYSLWYMH